MADPFVLEGRIETLKDEVPEIHMSDIGGRSQIIQSKIGRKLLAKAGETGP